jgi:Icc-related predicted phosphoesterase
MANRKVAVREQEGAESPRDRLEQKLDEIVRHSIKRVEERAKEIVSRHSPPKRHEMIDSEA